MAKKYKHTKTFTFEGKRYYIRGDTLQECYEKWGRKLADLESGKKQITKNMRFDAWVEEWLETYKEPTVSVETLDSYKSNIRVHIVPLLGAMPLKSIKAIHCQRVVNEMSGMSAKMLSRVSQLMFSIFDDAIDNGLMVDNPARKSHEGQSPGRNGSTFYRSQKRTVVACGFCLCFSVA